MGTICRISKYIRSEEKSPVTYESVDRDSFCPLALYSAVLKYQDILIRAIFVSAV